jgi:calcineurin-like phosphoesterase family protein
MVVFFISDTHFGHENIIRMCRRPFGSVAEMDEALIARWNERVGAADTIYHLGDFCYRNRCGADTYLRCLNGQIHLIAGNHDDETIAQHASLFASVSHIREIHEGDHRLYCATIPCASGTAHGTDRGTFSAMSMAASITNRTDTALMSAPTRTTSILGAWMKSSVNLKGVSIHSVAGGPSVRNRLETRGRFVVLRFQSAFGRTP